MGTKGAQWKDKPWKCENCSFLLGILSRDGSELRIKWRDLYVVVKEAEWVKVTCRRCSRENTIIGDKPQPSSCQMPAVVEQSGV